MQLVQGCLEMTSYIAFNLQLQLQPHVVTRPLGCPQRSGELGTEVAAGGRSTGTAASSQPLALEQLLLLE